MMTQQEPYRPFRAQQEIRLKVHLFILTIRCIVWWHKSVIGKKVVQLEYEAYEPMAKKVLLDIIQKARSKWSLKHIAIYHRTGTVPVGEVSVVIAASSAHREDSIHATEYLIDELKASCPIWKREVYEDGSVWKGACCTSKIGHWISLSQGNSPVIFERAMNKPDDQIL